MRSVAAVGYVHCNRVFNATDSEYIGFVACTVIKQSLRAVFLQRLAHINAV